MNIAQITKVISVLLIILTGFMCIPAFIALWCGEMYQFEAFARTIAITLMLSGLMLFLVRKYKPDNLSTRDSFFVVSMSWITGSFFGALPFYFSAAIPAFADCYFETMSGFTTTGASILTEIEGLPQSMLFWRSLTHWLGGMGIVVLTVAILPLLGIGGTQLLRAEAPGPSVDKITPRITKTAKILWFIYLFYTVAETILLMFGGMSLFDALTHTFGTLATGGFSPKNSSVGYYNSAYIDGIITLFMVLAGMNFILHFKLLTGKVGDLFKDTEFKSYLIVFFLATFIITLNLYFTAYYTTISKSFQYASFQVASILTTTGYATANFEEWPHMAQMVLVIIMFIGGCAGSTGGGIKVVRIVVLFKKSINTMRYLLHPRAIFPLKMNDKVVSKDITYAISSFFFIYIGMLLLTSFVVACANQDIVTSLTTALVTVGNIGPGFGNIGPTENYAFYPDFVKWFLSFAMMVGRLELYTVLVLFTPLFWRKARA